MAASYFGGEVKETRRYKVGKLLGTRTRNLLLMSATPHNGKEADFQLFMACSMQIGSMDASVESMRISGVLTPPPAQRDPRCRCPGRESQQITARLLARRPGISLRSSCSPRCHPIRAIRP